MTVLGRDLPTLERQMAEGRTAREQLPRGGLATLSARPSTYDPVARLLWQGESRVRELLPLRYQRMLASPLSFYRGSALLMAEDLARGSSTPLEVQISGDAHLSNFNLFSSPERRLVFDVDDFDETDAGPFEWDVKRLLASLVVASSYLGHSAAQQEAIARGAAREYRRSMRRLAHEPRLGIWYAALDVNAIVQDLGGFFTDNALRRVDDVVRRADRKGSNRATKKLISYTSNGPLIVSNPPLLVPLGELNDHYLSHEDFGRIIEGYARTLSSDRQALLGQFTSVDAARKVVGVGSVGTECYAVLLVGRDEYDPFFLQVKQATSSVVAVARGTESSTPHGERVVRGQRLMQATSDVFLGWYTFGEGSERRDFYVRQLYNDKAAISIDKLDEKLLVTYGRVCAWVLARAHARSGRGAQIAGYLGTSGTADDAFAEFAMSYSARTLEDYGVLRTAVKEGRITVAA